MVIRNYHSTNLNKKFSEKEKASFDSRAFERSTSCTFDKTGFSGNKQNRLKQTEFSFLKETKIIKKTHGGTKSNAKSKRPFVPNKWMHISNRSEIAKLDYSLLSFKHKLQVEKIIKDAAKKFFVTIGDKVIMSNHYHLKVKAKWLRDFQNFLRVINAKIAKLVMKAKKGNKVGKFWDGLTFSRLLTSAMDELNLKGYFQANRIQSVQGTKAREEFLKIFRGWMRDRKSRRRAETLDEIFAMFSTA